MKEMKCPKCRKLNPWPTLLDPVNHCKHCGASFRVDPNIAGTTNIPSNNEPTHPIVNENSEISNEESHVERQISPSLESIEEVRLEYQKRRRAEEMSRAAERIRTLNQSDVLTSKPVWNRRQAILVLFAFIAIVGKFIVVPVVKEINTTQSPVPSKSASTNVTQQETLNSLSNKAGDTWYFTYVSEDYSQTFSCLDANFNATTNCSAAYYAEQISRRDYDLNAGSCENWAKNTSAGIFDGAKTQISSARVVSTEFITTSVFKDEFAHDAKSVVCIGHFSAYIPKDITSVLYINYENSFGHGGFFTINANQVVQGIWFNALDSSEFGYSVLGPYIHHPKVKSIS